MADVLVEPEHFLVSLERLLGEALDGSGRLVFLGGEAGANKTALATILADAANPYTNTVYVTNQASGAVSVISG
jgi:predicted ATP-dependent serine protease